MSEYETHHEPAAPAPVSGRHRVNVAHLVMGTAFLGLVAVWALVVAADAVDIRDARWLLPLPWLVAGAVGLTATALRSRFPDRP